MKWFRLFMVLVVLLVLPAAGAVATTFTWTGASSAAWNTAANWDPSGGPPDDGTDLARITEDLNNPVSYSTGTVSIDTLLISGDGLGETVELVVSGGSLTTGGTTTVIGDLDGSATGTLTVSGGVFAPNRLALVGRENTTAGHAVLNLDVDVTVAASTTSTSVTGYVDCDVASTKVLTAKAVTVGSATLLGNLLIGAFSGTGEVDCTSLAIEADSASSGDSVVTLSFGVLDVNGLTSLTSSGFEQAKLIVNSGATYSPDFLRLAGGASEALASTVDFNETVTVENGGSAAEVTVTGHAEVDIANGETLFGKDITVGNGLSLVYLQVGFDGSPGTGELDATSLVITVGDSGTEPATLEFTSGTLDCNGTLTLQSSTVDAISKLIIASGTTINIDAMDFNGGTSAARAAAIVFNANVDLVGSATTVMTGFVTAQIAASIDFVPNELQIGDLTTPGNFTLVEDSGFLAEVRTTKLVVKGGAEDESVVTVEDGRIVTLN